MTKQNPRMRETKAVTSNNADALVAFEEFMTAFEVFKQTNDERLAQLENRSSQDVVTVEKMNRVSNALDEQKARMDQFILNQKRPHLSGESPRSVLPNEYKQAFDLYVRRGRHEALERLETKTMSVSSNVDGGYLVPEETAAEIGRRLVSASPIRAIAGKQQVSSSLYNKPFSKSGPAAGWVAETGAREESDTPVLSELKFPTMELYSMPAATPQLLEDAVFDVDSWIAGEVERAFAEQESKAFVKGDGVNKPKGFLKYQTVDDSKWEWGKLGEIATGVAGAFAEDHASDILMDTVYALKAGHRQMAHWVMNRKTQAEIRKFKDANGNYLWQPPAGVGQAAYLMGFGVVEAEDMPDIAADAHAIAFGDFAQGYLIVDRTGVRILRDPYSAKPYVLFYTTKRVGGGVQNFEAIKLIKFSAG